MKATPLYRKIGRKYVPVELELHTNGWPEGHYLVQIQPGRTSTRRTLKPDIAEITCALKIFADIVSEKMYQHGELTAYDKPCKEVLDALDEMKAKLGKKYPGRFKYEGVQAIVEEAIAELEVKLSEYKAKTIRVETIEI